MADVPALSRSFGYQIRWILTTYIRPKAEQYVGDMSAAGDLIQEAKAYRYTQDSQALNAFCNRGKMYIRLCGLKPGEQSVQAYSAK